MVAITKFTRDDIFNAVRQMYTEVARHPEKGFHFPSGRPACEFVGYPAKQLDAVPATAVESFAGVGYPFMCNAIGDGDRVLDIGAGAGTDALISSLIVGARGKVYGLDMTQAMHDKLHANVANMGANNVEPLFGNAEAIPLPDASIDVVTSNGVLNLMPDKPTVFAEIFRVLTPGGRIQISDIVIHKRGDELAGSKSNPQLWAECIVGAMYEDQYLEALGAAGFQDLRVLDHVNYFSRSENDSTRKVADYFGAESITLLGCKPA